MRAGFAQFAAFSQDAKDNQAFEQVKLTMPVLAVGGEKSFGPLQAVIMSHVATNVREAVIAGSGHWLMEECSAETVALIWGFLDASPEERLSSAEYKFPEQGNPGTGSSGLDDIRTVVLKGDPSQAGVYTIMLRVPAHTPDCGPLSPRRPGCHGDFRNLAHRLRRSVRRSKAESSPATVLLY
jgi:hypothetical protein